MKDLSKLLVVAIATVALAGFVACGGDDGNGGTDEGTKTDTIGPTDEGPGDQGGTDEGTCTPDCAGKECGPDGCGGFCGTCEADENCDADGMCVPCVPDCGDLECGPDPICGTECGPCADEFICDTAQGICLPECDWLTDMPDSWGPAGVISALQTPADKATAGAVCFDYTGEGTGDSGLVGLAGQVNGPLRDAIEGGDIGIIFEFAGVTDFDNTASFQLNGLLGGSTADPVVMGGDYVVMEDGYVQDTCMPLIYFRGANITDGVLAAGPSNFRLSIPLDETLVLDVTLIEAQIKAEITEGGVDGVAATGGVLSGILTKQELETVLGALEAECDAAPVGEKPDFCDYLSIAKTAMALLFDLHQLEDGTYIPKSAQAPGNAASVCMTFDLAKATVVGFEM